MIRNVSFFLSKFFYLSAKIGCTGNFKTGLKFLVYEQTFDFWVSNEAIFPEFTVSSW